MKDTYALLDSGGGRKLEQFGPYLLDRPASQAMWEPRLPPSEWRKADGIFTREEDFRWIKSVKSPWTVSISGIAFKLSTTSFGHLGLFPEQKQQWEWMEEIITAAMKKRKRPLKVLNLFAYSGGATLVAAKAGAEVCHLDASKGMVEWARENATLNTLEDRPIRWIVEDVKKFLAREARRSSLYDGIVLDPPTYGRGRQGQVFKFERDIVPLLRQCVSLLGENPLFLLLSCHTPNLTPLGLHHILSQAAEKKGGTVEAGEMCLEGRRDVLPLPTGIFARWRHG